MAKSFIRQRLHHHHKKPKKHHHHHRHHHKVRDDDDDDDADLPDCNGTNGEAGVDCKAVTLAAADAQRLPMCDGSNGVYGVDCISPLGYPVKNGEKAIPVHPSGLS